MITLFIVCIAIVIPPTSTSFSPRSSNNCNVATIINSLTNGVLQMNDVEVTESTVITTDITIVCDTGYSLAYGIKSSFSCNEWNPDSDYKCRSKCRIQSLGSTTLSPVFVVGTNRNLTNGDELLHGESISVSCNTSGHTVTGSTNTTQQLTCDSDDSKYLVVKKCQLPCNISSLTLTNNTSIKPSPLVGVGQKVTVICQENFMTATSVNLDIICSSDSSFSDTIPSSDQCYAIPIVKVMASGDRQVEISATVDQSYDRNGPKLEKALYQIENKTIRTLVNNIYSAMNTGWDYTNGSIGYGTQLKVTVQLYYSGLSSPLIGTGTGMTGPPPITTNDWIAKFSGTSVLELWFKDLTDLKQLYPALTFRVDVVSGVRRLNEIKEELVWSVISKLDSNQKINNNVYDGDTIIIPLGMLLEAQSCTVRVTSLSGNVMGGSANYSSSIGLSAPSLIGIDVSVGSATIKFYHPLLDNTTYWPWVVILNDITYNVNNIADSIGDVVREDLQSNMTYSYNWVLKGSDGSVSESFQTSFTTSSASTESEEIKISKLDNIDTLAVLIALIVVLVILVVLVIVFIYYCKVQCTRSKNRPGNGIQFKNKSCWKDNLDSSKTS